MGVGRFGHVFHKTSPGLHWFSLYRASSYTSAVLRVVIVSVCLSVTHVHHDKTKQCTADIVKGQSLCCSDTNSGWCATPPSVWNLRSKWPTPFKMCRLRQICAYNVSTVRDTKKKFNCDKIGSRPWAFQRAIDGVRTLPPMSLAKGGSETIIRLKKIKANISPIKSATKFLCVKSFIGKVVVWPFPCLTVHR